jgi:hypothetical protein
MVGWFTEECFDALVMFILLHQYIVLYNVLILRNMWIRIGQMLSALSSYFALERNLWKQFSVILSD